MFNCSFKKNIFVRFSLLVMGVLSFFLFSFLHLLTISPACHHPSPISSYPNFLQAHLCSGSHSCCDEGILLYSETGTPRAEGDLGCRSYSSEKAFPGRLTKLSPRERWIPKSSVLFSVNFLPIFSRSMQINFSPEALSNRFFCSELILQGSFSLCPHSLHCSPLLSSCVFSSTGLLAMEVILMLRSM